MRKQKELKKELQKFERLQKEFNKKQNKKHKKAKRRRNLKKALVKKVFNNKIKKKRAAKGVLKMKKTNKLFAILAIGAGFAAVVGVITALSMRVKQKAITDELEANCIAEQAYDYSEFSTTAYDKASIDELERALLRVENQMSAIENALDEKRNEE